MSDICDRLSIETKKREARLRVLVVDDDKTSTRLFSDALSDVCEVVQANSGEDFIRALTTQEPFDYAFIDMRLGNSDAIEFFQQISHLTEKGDIGYDFFKIPWYLITGYNTQDIDLERLKGFNMLARKEKPFKLEDVRKIVLNHIDSLETDSDQVSLKVKSEFDRVMKQFSAYSAIIVDDSNSALEKMTCMLETVFEGLPNFKVDRASTRDAAVCRMLSTRYDAAFLDYRLDQGTTCSSILRELDELRIQGRLPYDLNDTLIFYVTGEDPAVRALTTAAQEFNAQVLWKPVTADDLARVIVERVREGCFNAYYKRLEERMLNAARDLTGKLAHRARNILVGFSGNLEIARGELWKTKEQAKAMMQLSIARKLGSAIDHCDKAIEAQARITDLLTTMTEINRRTPKPNYIDLRNIVTLASQALGADYTNVTFSTQFPEKLFSIYAHGEGILEALLIIGSNAVQAHATNVDFSVHTDDKYLTVRVKDNGDGIPMDILDRILEPKVSSKEKGAGLGLSIIVNTMDVHDGEISYENNEDKGASFYLRFKLPR